MSTNTVINRNFQEMFSGNVRFEIPFFQRGYAWEQRQWKKLFEDIQSEIVDNVVNGNFEDQEHFFGPVVVLEKFGPHPSLKRFLVIDGQQRITTVYLMLALIRKQLALKAHLSSDAQEYIAELDHLLRNGINDEDDYLKIKIYSTKGDRLPTYTSVFNNVNPSSPFLGNDQLLYNPATNQIDAFNKFASRQISRYDVPQLRSLYEALTKSLKIVWIPLDERKDDPQAIFESLNDAGMPLSASELLCNYIFRPLTNETSNEHEQLHNEKWLAARRAVGEVNFENYLRDLFTIGERKRVGLGRRMYVHYKVKHRNINSVIARNTLNQILDYTSVYRNIIYPIQYPPADSGIKRWIISIKDTNMTSIYPFLMQLLKENQDGNITNQDTEKLLRETYVLLVRRKITRLPTTKYDTFFPSLLNKIIHEPDKLRAFQSQVQSEQLWVPNQIFSDAFPSKELYNSRELNFSRHVLQELDKSMQDFGENPDYSTLQTIEHILPQTPDVHWRTYLGHDAQNINLPTITNTIGNLCLNSSVANSTFGRKPFEEKQALYTDVSALARDVKKWKAVWDISAIETRSRALAIKALDVWKWHV